MLISRPLSRAVEVVVGVVGAGIAGVVRLIRLVGIGIARSLTLIAAVLGMVDQIRAEVSRVGIELVVERGPRPVRSNPGLLGTILRPPPTPAAPAAPLREVAQQLARQRRRLAGQADARSAQHL